MAITGTAGLLDTWEAGLAEAPAGRALLLHRTARPDSDPGTLVALPVGEREADLFALRRALFGERMQVRMDCRTCGQDMEFELDAGRFARSATGPREPVVRLAEDGWEIEFRLPGPADLTAAARSADPRAALLARCLVSAVRDGAPAPAGALPTHVQRRLAETVETADPAADLTLDVRCPECGAATRAELDIASYLWTELDSWARDLLLDVHLLATAYGWSEPEILALSPLRRRYYLELCADV
ncbi:T4 family baseplate hub assembly chaperone [Streptomyces sp. NPDC002514]|uniref:T4 family baseplate hub assembly chaperone n=1 Tax=Streptomyces sp. NPDC001270 TaxID=3364554 RepID=UPI0036B8BA3F